MPCSIVGTEHVKSIETEIETKEKSVQAIELEIVTLRSDFLSKCAGRALVTAGK